jgi:cellulose synthase/poly-beta-1,6-N-acetylglucosamine synthase-like glycosyltransferase
MIFETFFESIYLLVVAVIWLMLVYQGALTFAGYLYSRRCRRQQAPEPKAWPFVSILIPARNEEKVIAETARRMLALDYPHDKLELLIVNDGSTDRTKEILASLAAQEKRLTVINVLPEESGKGKSRVLNLAVRQTKGDLVAVYDADNRPEKDALKLLVRELVADNAFVATIGKFRTINKDSTILTRFINIESFSFQWIIQAGRSFLFDIAILPGTNFVIRKKAVLDVGGWDEKALTEDAELSLRLYRAGGKIKFVPQSVTREQEPEQVKVWLRQRERWVRGNNYVLMKLLPEFRNFKNKKIGLEFLAFSLMYYFFFGAMLLSNIFFILGLLNILHIRIQGPFLEVWITAYMLFVSEIVLTLSREPNEDSPKNVLYVILMYFTYCQLWLIVVASAFIKDFVMKEKMVWYKTERTADVSAGGR